MSDFHGTCGTCVLWVKLPFRDIGQCCVTHAVNLDSLYPCDCADKRTAFIRFLVTSPEFVPEEVQKQIATTWTPRDPGWQVQADGLSVTMTNEKNAELREQQRAAYKRALRELAAEKRKAEFAKEEWE